LITARDIFSGPEPVAEKQTRMNRLDREKKTISRMIELFCRVHHRAGNVLCDDCARLLDYALERIDRCVHGQKKPACAKCSTRCASPAMRERIRRVMRFAGPRMIIAHPLLALLHVVDGLARKGKDG